MADQAPRSGPLPRALVAVSNVLTTLPPLRSFWSESDCSLVARAGCPPPRRPRDPGEPMTTTAPSSSTRPPGPRRHRPARSAVHRRASPPSCWSPSCCCPARGPPCCRRPGACCSRSGRRAACSTRRTRGCSATLVRPRLAAPDQLEDPAPPRFAQAVGLAFAVVALVGFASGARPCSARSRSGSPWSRPLLNAVFGFCLGCELYLLDQAAQPPPLVEAPAASLEPTHDIHATNRKKEPHEPRELARHRPVGRGAPRRPAASS